MMPGFEVKWVKASPAKIELYRDLMDYFFDDDDLHFRCLVVPNKNELEHRLFNQTHDEFYYKMYFDMLKAILSPEEAYLIYLDYKDTQGGSKVKSLHDVLCNNLYDFSRSVVRRVQIIRSEEAELLQLADLLIGAIAYANRNLETSHAKLDLVKRMRERSGYQLTKSTLLRETKTNIFVWAAT